MTAHSSFEFYSRAKFVPAVATGLHSGPKGLKMKEDAMLTTQALFIDGMRITFPLGKLKAFSPWYASGYSPIGNEERDRLLRELIRHARDLNADAVVAIDYGIDATVKCEDGIAFKRICATATAVKLAIRSPS